MNEIKLSYYKHNKKVPHPIKRGRLSSHELTFLISGSMSYIIDGVRHELVPKSAVFVPAGCERERPPAKTECDYVSFNFTSEAAPELPYYIESAYHSEIALIISALDRIASKPQLSAYDRGAELLSSIVSLLEDYERAEKMSPLTISILGYIHRNYKSRVTLADLAESFFFSAGYCEAVFSEDMGRSVIDYVLELRISEAERLLLESSAPLSAIAEEVGFSDYNYFSRVFRRRVGISPKEYRKLNNS